MKRMLLVFVLSLFASVSFASKGDLGFGDDVFPWPWGTECPFPWAEIEGAYKVRGFAGRGQYTGYFIHFERTQAANQNFEVLQIKQFGRRGQLIAKGQVYSSRDQRIVKGILRSVTDNHEFVVIVRSYMKDRQATCQPADLVTAITFCPLRGRRCLADSNYTLEKLH